MVGRSQIAAYVFAALAAIAQPACGQASVEFRETLNTAAAGTVAPSPAPDEARPKPFPLPFLAEEAQKRGIVLPPPFGIGLVYYKLYRDIKITDVRVGRNGAPPTSVSKFADFGSTADVDNLNLKFDVWLLPFFNVYAIVGRVKNESTTNIDVTLPPLTPAGSPRSFQLSVPTGLNATVGGLGMTLAGGYGPFFMALDSNVVRANLGFDEPFQGIITSARAGWNGEADLRPLRIWLNVTYWDTFATAKGTVADPDGGTLSFEVDQGPKYPITYGVGASYGLRKWLDFSVDTGMDFHGGWYVAIVPVGRF